MHSLTVGERPLTHTNENNLKSELRHDNEQNKNIFY